MTDKQTNPADELAEQLKKMLPSGREIHDAIMEPIEPDLLTTNLPGLPEKYKDETEPERLERVKRYQQAIKAYEEAARVFFAKLDAEVDAHRDSVEQASIQHDQEELSGVESKLFPPDAS